MMVSTHYVSPLLQESSSYSHPIITRYLAFQHLCDVGKRLHKHLVTVRLLRPGHMHLSLLSTECNILRILLDLERDFPPQLQALVSVTQQALLLMIYQLV